MISGLRKSLIIMLAFQLGLSPIMMAYAQPVTTDSITHYGSTHNEYKTDDFQLSDPLREVRISTVSYKLDLCDMGNSGNDRCSACSCIKAGVFNFDLSINNLLYQPSISTDITNTLYYIHITPPFRPPIS